jgi:hypothetical protein
MRKQLPFILYLFLAEAVFSQGQLLQYKKGRRMVSQWWTGQVFTCQLRDGSWQKGELARVTADSFYITNTVVRYGLFGTDTAHFGISGFRLADVYALPKYGLPVEYVNGHYEIVPKEGGMHFYWLKSGYIFRLGAAVYAGAWLANSLIQHDLSLENSHLGVAAGVFAFGVLLHKIYKPVIRMKGKRHFEVVKI